MIIKDSIHSGGASGTLDKFAVFMVRNGTQVARRYKKPIDKKTASQLASRAQFGSLSGTWRDELLESERATWKSYTVKSTGVFGASKTPSSLAKFKGVNQILLKASKNLQKTAPLQSAPPVPELTITAASDTANVSIAAPSADDITLYRRFSTCGSSLARWLAIAERLPLTSV